MYKILDSLVRLLAPVLVHTAEEVWEVMKFKSSDADSIHLADMPKVDSSIDYLAAESKWQKLMDLRDKVLGVLEPLRKDKIIGSSQEATVTIYCRDEETAEVLNEFGLERFAALCIVSEVKLQDGAGETKVVAEKSSHQKCQRCWNYWPSVGKNSKFPDICDRCVEVISKIGS
jgi:isoleucyl-tRNA synthetase